MNAERIAQSISDWIARKVHEAGARGVVVGLSGGVDSAVVLALSQRAVGSSVLGVIMPCGNSDADAQDALLVAGTLSAGTITVPLDKAYRVLTEAVPDATRTACGNLKARLRMAILYAHANSLNYIVAGTGNRCELAVGYFTKYGDGGVDILPIGGLVKSEVRQLARHLGIPPRIINRTPTAGLWPGQTDEGELGITYDVLDEIVEALDNERQPRAPADALARVKALMTTSEHKRALPPICPVIRR